MSSILEDIIIDNDDAPDTKVKASFTEGWGLFAGRDFKKGEVIVDYGLFPDSWYETTYVQLSKEEIDKNWYVMLDNERCITSDKWSKFSYINHSRKPNCFWDLASRKISAARDVVEGDELFIDYRTEPSPKGVEPPPWL